MYISEICIVNLMATDGVIFLKIKVNKLLNVWNFLCVFNLKQKKCVIPWSYWLLVSTLVSRTGSPSSLERCCLCASSNHSILVVDCLLKLPENKNLLFSRYSNSNCIARGMTLALAVLVRAQHLALSQLQLWAVSTGDALALEPLFAALNTLSLSTFGNFCLLNGLL